MLPIENKFPFHFYIYLIIEEEKKIKEKKIIDKNRLLKMQSLYIPKRANLI